MSASMTAENDHTDNEGKTDEKSTNDEDNKDNKDSETDRVYRAAVIDEEQIWAIIRSYFQEHQMNESKIRSYNKFVSEGLPNIIRNASPFVVQYHNMWHIFEFKRVTMNKPVNTEGDGSSHALFPKEARLRGLSYASDVYLHVVHQIMLMPHAKKVPLDQVQQEGKLTYSQYFPYVKSIKFATMLKSVLCHLTDAAQDYGECIFDSGGYFIINGGEKMLMYRERMAYNKIFCYTKKDASYTHYAELRSEHYGQFRSTNTLYMMLSKATKTEAPSLYINGVPLVTWLRALGCTTDRAIYTRFRFVAGERWSKNNNSIYEEYVYNCLENNQGIATRTDALVRIGKLGADKDLGMQRHNGLLYIKQKLLPHVGYDERDFTFKLFALLDIACKLFDFVQDSTLKTDKDSYFNKRVEAPEDLLGTLTRQLFASYLNSIKVNILKRLEKKKSISVHEIFSDNKVSKGIADSLASGMWHATRDKITQTGVSQKMERMNYISTQAQHTKIINPLRKEGKQTGPRLLVSTAYGVVCPADSPEGASCLHVDEPVLLPDGSYKSIGKLKDGDEVVTLDRETLQRSVTKIHHHFIRCAADVVKVTTTSGRTVICTTDHPFLTQLGMVEAKDLDRNAHRLCVFPTITPLPSTLSGTPVSAILTAEVCSQRLLQAKVVQSLARTHVSKLTALGLLPLGSNHPHLPILARLYGLAMSDGTTNVYREGHQPQTKFFLGTQYDNDLMQSDMVSMGFERQKATYETNEFFGKEEGEMISRSCWVVNHYGCFASLLIALGVMRGKRTEQPHGTVPDWIMTGSQLVKREFLAGFQGGDGSRINIRKNVDGYCVGWGATSQHKAANFVDSLVVYMRQVADLFVELGVKVASVSTIPPSLKRPNRSQVVLRLCTEESNMLHFATTIGYRYATTKTTFTHQACEYIRYKLRKLETKENLRRTIIEMRDGGMSTAQVAAKYKVTRHYVSNVLYYRDRVVQRRNKSKDILSADKWLEMTSAQTNCVFVPIESVEPAPPCDVSDFTTESETHNFIGGAGFCVSNCGLVKHHAVLSHCSLDTDPHTITHLLFSQCRVIPFDQMDDTLMNNILDHLDRFRYVLVRVNGRAIGIFPSAEGIAEFIRKKRRSLSISPDTSVSYTDIDVDVRTDRGRNMRPLFVVDNLYKLSRMLKPSNACNDTDENARYPDHFSNNAGDNADTDRFAASRICWNDLLAEGIIEYVDKEEEMILVIAKDFSVLRKNEYKCSHMEVHGSVLFGVSASLIPFPDHNQSPRNTYQCISASTLVTLSDGTSKRIDELRDGDMVLTIDPVTLRASTTKIYDHFTVRSKATQAPVVKITTSDGRCVSATADHRFLARDFGWLEACHIDTSIALAVCVTNNTTPGNNDQPFHCEFVSVVSVEPQPDALVCDFTTESENHSFVANGFVSANCQMGRQSQGIHSSNAKQHRMDISLLELWYAQRPLVETQLSKILNCQKFPTGQNMMVAVASIGQEGQEDAHLLGKSPVELGLARSDVSRVVTVQEKRHGKMTALEEFAKMDPKKCLGRKKGDYTKIESDGLVALGARVKSDTVIVQKGLPINDALGGSSAATSHLLAGGGSGSGAPSSGQGGSGGSGSSSVDPLSKFTPQTRDTSISLQNSEHGTVDRVMITSGNDNLKTAKVRYTKVSVPQKGDKFSTRHGQKGTIGALIPREDLFWTEDGICPDIIINAIAFTSRMTFGQFVECLLGIVCCMTGRFGDATPFSSCYRDALYKTIADRMKYFKPRPGPRQVVDEISDALKHLGIPSAGDRVMRSGVTGKLLKGRIFMGMTYVQKLKHLVSDKIRSRARGKLQALTRQPAEGRINNGGLRWGQMENDAVQAHGAANNVRDRLCLSSDLSYDHICLVCSRSAVFHSESGLVYCNFCDKYGSAAVVALPYAFHLFKQELGAINVDVKLHVETL